MQGMQVRPLGWEDPLEKGMAIHSSILAWEIPWTEEPGRLQTRGSQRVRRELAIKQQQETHISTYCRNTSKQCQHLLPPKGGTKYLHRERIS